MKTLLVALIALFAVACGGQSTEAKAPDGAPADTAAASDAAAPAADTAAPAADAAAPAAEAPKK
ncbi:MAG: hypothetical protein FJ095_16260 [Deltaproteobacteria bacterium]|nr:hypothetical protein [Deltaproteobacteria bacterium]